MRDKNITFVRLIKYPPKHFLKIEKKYIHLSFD